MMVENLFILFHPRFEAMDCIIDLMLKEVVNKLRGPDLFRMLILFV